MRVFLFLRPVYTLYIRLFPQPKPTWTLILGSGMISLLEPRRRRAGTEERCATGSTLDLKLARLLREACADLG